MCCVDRLNPPSMYAIRHGGMDCGFKVFFDVPQSKKWETHRYRSLIYHSVRGSQHVSIRYNERLAEARIEPSIGSKRDSLDNALVEIN
jgi:transposase InsO family protein